VDPTIEVADGAGLATRTDGRWILVSDRAHVAELAAAVNATGHRDDLPLRWVASAPGAADAAAAADAGLRPVRDVLQLRRSLPVDPDVAGAYPAVKVRPFRPGSADEENWVACNNRAFAGHPDQSGFTLGRLHRLMAEPWFDPAGFLVHEQGDDMIGFCWTKVHADSNPPLGEIFVIGIDPAFGGRGLGGSITLAGLDFLADRGLRTAMLYVDAENASARRMYARLGFTLHHTDRIFESAR
jgi:mycothiol synthase